MMTVARQASQEVLCAAENGFWLSALVDTSQCVKKLHETSAAHV